MSNALIALRALLMKPALQTSGVVIEILRNATYRVRTMSGSLEVKAAGNAAYGLGDEVLVRDGTIQGRVRDIATVPVYNV